MFFGDWWGLFRVVVAAMIGYATLLLFLRISGKRTLSKLNAFDLVITISLGSTLSTLVLSRTTPILEGVLALGVLIGLQFLVASLQIRYRRFEIVVKSEPTLLLYRGTLRREAMFRERVTESEVKAAIRDSGGTSIEGTLAVILETDGSLVAISPSSETSTAMASLRGLDRETEKPSRDAA